MRNGTPEERFWRKVEKRSPDDCWEWKGNCCTNGYGQLRVGKLGLDRRMVQVHRFSFELHKGPLGKSLCLHTCDNRKCVNPNQLYAGTPANNMEDRSARGRAPSDTRKKLTKSKALAIRGLYAGGIGRGEIAWLYKISRQSVDAVVTGQSWTT